MGFIDLLKEKFYRLWYGKKGDKEWQRIMKTLGNPGIWFYVKKQYYEDALKLLDENDEYHDLKKTQGEIKEVVYKNFEYKNEIIECDFSHESLSDDDTIIFIWRVNKKKLDNE